MKQVIGMDGGGTSTKARLYAINEDGSLGACIRETEAGSSNINSNSEASIVQNFRLIKEELQAEEAVAVCLGVAGISTPGAKEKLTHMLIEAGFPDFIVLRGDHEIALRAAFGKEDGILLIAGTGAIAFAQQNGRLLRAGGYGYLIDDGGSAFSIGLRMLSEWIRYYDGRRPPAAMLDALTEKLGKSKEEALRQVMNIAYAQPFVKSKIADLAKVFGVYLDQEEPLALEIANDAVEALQIHVEALAKQMPRIREIPVVFSGGVLGKNEKIRTALQLKLEEGPYLLRVEEMCVSAAEGAAGIALEEYYA